MLQKVQGLKWNIKCSNKKLMRMGAKFSESVCLENAMLRVQSLEHKKAKIY